MTDTRDGTRGRGQPSTSDTGTASVERLATDLSAWARDLEQHDDPDSMLTAIVAGAVALIPGAEDGSISTVQGRRRVSSAAATSDLPRRIDQLQEELGEGPCLDSIYEQETVRVDDVATERRWPQFAEQASRAGAGSMLSLQLYVEGDNLGALNLLSRKPHSFTDESEQVGLLYAAHAAVALIGVRKETQLAQALVNRDLIGQAKGILIERYKMTGDRAFIVLTRLSQTSNRKLHDVAAELVRTGTVAGALPPAPQ